MPACKNNQYWKVRTKHGRDAIFNDPNVLLAAAYEYFEWNAQNQWHKNEPIKSGENAGKIIKVPTERPLTLEGLTQFLGVNRKYLIDFENRLPDSNEGFSQVIMHIKEVIRRQQTEGGIVGAFNANIISRMLGLTDKIENSGTVTHVITGMQVI